jgi:hypothetical protein
VWTIDADFSCEMHCSATGDFNGIDAHQGIQVPSKDMFPENIPTGTWNIATADHRWVNSPSLAVTCGGTQDVLLRVEV